MKPCISQACTLASSFAEDVVNFAEAGWPGMEVWLTKLEKHLQTHTLAETRQLLADHPLQLAAASYQGGLLLSRGAERQAHFETFRRRLELCQGFGIPTLVLAADFATQVDQAILDTALASLRQAAQWAAAFDVRLALEFRGRASFCSSLDTAAGLVAACGEPNLALCFDVFHYYTGPSKFEDLGYLNPTNLALVQACDVAGGPRELAGDGDRIFPGDGDFQLTPILRQIRASGYEGWVSLEMLNPTLSQCPPSQVAELGLAALQRVLAQP